MAQSTHDVLIEYVLYFLTALYDICTYFQAILFCPRAECVINVCIGGTRFSSDIFFHNILT
jgi:hypothetical protein